MYVHWRKCLVFQFLKKKNDCSDECRWIKAAVQAAKENKIDPVLFVALILNESSGNPFATRWERRFFLRYVAGRPLDTLAPYRGSLDNYEQDLLRISLAYSWGLCQIMGVVAIEHGFRGRQMWELLDVETNVSLGARIFAGFRDGIARTSKDLSAEELQFKTLLRYNGGGDADYPSRVLKRMAPAGELLKRCGC